jgi:DNA-binding SARP family transcriptional activator
LVEASIDGREAALGGAKQRALLAMLALQPNAPVSADRLIEGLWGERAPSSALKMVQLYVSQLRKLIDDADAEILTRGRGYELRLPAEAVDAVRFERLVAEAARAEATPNTLAREALALWRGPPLDDIADEPFAAAEIRRLQDLWLRARELAIDDALAAGEHGTALGELEDLVAEHPLREGLHAQRMLALYRAGRQAEALEAYRHARDVLVQEVGLEPGPELRALHEAILRQDPAVDAPTRTAPAPAEVARSAFVGRERELAELTAGLDDGCAGRGRLFLLAGEPGIGKSRLADELIAHARTRGARVLVGRCWEAGGAPAYWPWVQSLRAYVRATEPGELRSQLGTGAAELAQLLPELRELFADLPEPAAPGSEGARFRLFEAVSAFLASAARTRPLVLFLDDLHAADEPSLLLLQFVAREVAASRVLVLCAFRDVDPTMSDPLTGALAQLVREPHTRQIALAGLSEPDAAQYIERSTGNVPSPRLVRAVHAETEGNPLFVVEVVRLLDAGGLSDAEAPLRIPPGVRAVIGQRMRGLSERCRSALIAASVMAGSSSSMRSPTSAGWPAMSCSTSWTRRWPSASSPTHRDRPGGFASATC